MDLENRVSRQRYPVPTALRCCEAGNLWVSVFKDRTATLSMLKLVVCKDHEPLRYHRTLPLPACSLRYLPTGASGLPSPRGPFDSETVLGM